MTRITLYAAAIARIIVLLIGYIFYAFFFVFAVIGQIGALYLAAFTTYASQSAALFKRISELK